MAEPEKSEATRSQSLPWLVLSGLLGLYAVGTPVSHPTATKDTGKNAAKADPAIEQLGRVPETDALLKPLQQFFATHDGRWNPDDLSKELHGYETEFLIATVPDPIDSPFGYSFDQTVDAIQRAVQQKSGYLLDRAWLPWEVDRNAKPVPGKEPSNLRETTPGVLLFRHGKDAARGIAKPGLCVVLLVGETPLGGIHKRAFWKALEQIARAGHPLNDPIRVVGPYFTGSQTSLQFVLRDWCATADGSSWLLPRRPWKFKIVFGNASGIRTREFFRSEWGPEQLEIGATVAPARVQLNAVLHFLAERDGARAADEVSGRVVKKVPGSVAILAESNTGFGKQFAAYGDHNQVVVLRFPLHVSRLKSEYAQVFRKKDEQAGLKTDAAIASSGFEDAGGEHEGVPAQGGTATAAANNAVLANILSTVSRERFRYVGVMATDTRDKLFLIRLIREHCPDTHVFVTDGDVLLTHPDYRYHMKGVLVGSTYPLFPPNQQWVNPTAPERLLLSSSAAQGYYNATLAVLGVPDQMLEYSPPAFAAEGAPTGRPPVWVSMIAPNGTIVPLQLFTGYEDTHGYVWVKPEGSPVAPPTGLRYPASLYLMGMGLVAFWGVLLAKCWRGRGLWAAGADAGHTTPVGLFRTVLLGAQLVFAVAAVAVASSRAEHYGYRAVEDIVILAVGGAAWVLFLAVALRGVSFRRPPAEGLESRRWWWNVVNLLVIAGLVGFTVAFLGRFWGTADRPHRALFFVRAVDLATGLSPLTPLFLMCMAITAGAYFQMERHYLARRCRVPSPFPPDADRVFDPLTDQDRRLKVEMSPSRFWKRHRLAITALVVGLAVGGTMVWRQALPTVEGVVWDAVFAVGFWCIYAFAAFTVLQTLVLWRHTKQLLGTVARMPMMRVFARLPSRVSAGVAKHLYSRAAQPLLLKMSVHQLRALVDAAAADPSAPPSLRELGPVADDAESRLQEYVNPAHGQPGDPVHETALRDLLSNACEKSLAVLTPRWKALPTDEAFGGPPATAADEAAWVGRAEELVATHMVNYLSQFMIQVRSLILAGLVCSSMLLMAATCYPFHPERLLLLCLLGLVGAGVATVMYVFIDASRDETVSRVARSSGRLSLDNGLIGPFMTYVVPTLGLMAAQLSGTFRWALEPILRVMK